jgi:serine/threonine-protein kinase
MPLDPGTTLGPYRIVAALGSGGMGEVYRAHDPRLNREVALKVLRRDVANDLERLQRFRNESRLIAGLNHPNICAVHDVGVAGDTHYMVMELVGGDTLAAVLRRGPLSIVRGLAIAADLAGALDRAHRAGIVHRDLKPANVIVGEDRVKLLDFGVAKLRADVTPSDGQTRSMMQTAEGALRGTIPYMAPEQVDGGSVDARTDIWALGCVIYEMLGGRQPFAAPTSATLIASILRDTPPALTTLVSDLPQSAERVVNACLEKSPNARWASAADLQRQLQWLGQDLKAHAAGNTVAAQPPLSKTSRGASAATAFGAVAVVVSAFGLGITLERRGTPSPAMTLRAEIGIAPAESLRTTFTTEVRAASGRPSRTSLALSPDGRTLAFVGQQDGTIRLYRRSLDGNTAAPLADTEGADGPFFSPDSQRIGFWADGALRWVPVIGGPVHTIVTTQRVAGASWLENDSILFGGVEGVQSIDLSGGQPTFLTRVNQQAGETAHRFPQQLPGGRNLLLTVFTGSNPRDAQVVAYRPDEGTYTVLVENASDGRFIGGTYLMALRAGALLVAPFDYQKLELTGPLTTVLDDVMHSDNKNNTSINTGAGQLAVSMTGHIAYLRGGSYPNTLDRLAWFDRRGARLESLLPNASPGLMNPMLASDARIAAYHQQARGGPFIFDPKREALTQLAFAGTAEWPVWSPDAQRIAFLGIIKGRPALYWMPADGSAPAQALVQEQARDPNPKAWSPDGGTLLYDQGGDIFRVNIRDQSIEPVLVTEATEVFPALSPDGRWLAYASNYSGRGEVYVSSYPSLSGRRQVSNNGGLSPVWTPNRPEILYLEPVGADGFRMMAVDFKEAGVLPTPTLLFAKSNREFSRGRFAVSADGQRLLATVPDQTLHPPPTEIQVVFNWMNEVDRLTSSGKR